MYRPSSRVNTHGGGRHVRHVRPGHGRTPALAACKPRGVRWAPRAAGWSPGPRSRKTGSWCLPTPSVQMRFLQPSAGGFLRFEVEAGLHSASVSPASPAAKYLCTWRDVSSPNLRKANTCVLQSWVCSPRKKRVLQFVMCPVCKQLACACVRGGRHTPTSALPPGSPRGSSPPPLRQERAVRHRPGLEGKCATPEHITNDPSPPGTPRAPAIRHH